MKNFKEYMPPMPGEAEGTADCSAASDDDVVPYLCTRGKGHDGERRAHSFSGLLATWEDGDE